MGRGGKRGFETVSSAYLDVSMLVLWSKGGDGPLTWERSLSIRVSRLVVEVELAVSRCCEGSRAVRSFGLRVRVSRFDDDDADNNGMGFGTAILFFKPKDVGFHMQIDQLRRALETRKRIQSSLSLDTGPLALPPPANGSVDTIAVFKKSFAFSLLMLRS